MNVAAHHSMMEGKLAIQSFGKTLGEGSLSNANGSIIPFKNITISCWYKSVQVAATQWETIWQVETIDGYGLSFGQRNQSYLYLSLQRGGGNVRISYIQNQRAWHHYALTVSDNGVDYKIYIDGLLVYSGQTNGADLGYNQIFLLRAVAGLMCKPVYWGVELSAAEVLDDYNSRDGALIRESDIVSYWPNGVVDGVIEDTVGNHSINANSRYYNSPDSPWAT